MKSKTFIAGPVQAIWEPESTFLRLIKTGSCEILRGIYIALRNQNWDTLTPTLEDYEEIKGEDTTRITFALRWKDDLVDYRGRVELVGQRDGVIAYTFMGESHSTFLRNRIGFVVLHPSSVAGKPVDVEFVDGKKETVHFPRSISAHQPVLGIRTLTHMATPELAVKVTMEGDTFEMEDQRNWTDASFKTYCTPLDLPFPVDVKPGDKIKQRITLKLENRAGSPPAVTSSGPVNIKTVSGSKSYPIPLIGLEVPSVSLPRPLPEAVRSQLSGLDLDHIRVSLDLAGPDAVTNWADAVQLVRELNCNLEAALYLESREQFASFLRSIGPHEFPPMARWLGFNPKTKATPPELTRQIKEMLKAGNIPGTVGAGTDHFFAELNRDRHAIEGSDFSVFSSNPQVHAFDDRSLMETIGMLEVCVESARSFSDGRPIVVSPLTFKMRSNPNATGKAVVLDVMARTDPRQKEPFGAVWTLGALFYLSRARTHAVTLFEVCGPLGIMDAGTGEAFPLLQAVRLFSLHKGCTVNPMDNSDPLRAIAFRIVDGKGIPVMQVIANLTSDPLEISLEGKILVLSPYQIRTEKLLS